MSTKLQELIARARLRTEELKRQREQESKEVIDRLNAEQEARKQSDIAKQADALSYNEEQSRFISLASSGAHAVLIGAAGTGKTTTMKGTIAAMLQSTSSYIPAMQDKHKHLPTGTPGIVATSYTRRSVANLKRAMPEDMKGNCITIHKLLEYQPTWYTVFDELTGESKTKMEFVPNRSYANPLSSDIKVVIIDEASTVSVELYQKLVSALPHDVQFIFLGDIQQLPPVFGSAILGYKGVELENSTVELVNVYRQALDSPIIRLAHRILSGRAIGPEEYKEWKYPGQLTIHPWKKKISADNALLTVAAFFKQAYNHGSYDPEQDMILIPFNKSCGTDELNKHIANHIARSSNRETFEIIAGYNKVYLSIGDTIMYDKEDAVVISISHNGNYAGKFPQASSRFLDYWGHRIDEDSGILQKVSDSAETEEELEFRLEQLMNASVDSIEEKTNQASHIVTIRRKDGDEEIVLDTAAEVNAISLGYSITVHKSQGSEWRKVFCVFHQSHATMMQRELLYTAVTRAREELYVICEPDTFTKGIINQRIKGETLAEKFEWFKGKMNESEMEIS